MVDNIKKIMNKMLIKFNNKNNDEKEEKFTIDNYMIYIVNLILGEMKKSNIDHDVDIVLKDNDILICELFKNMEKEHFDIFILSIKTFLDHNTKKDKMLLPIKDYFEMVKYAHFAKYDEINCQSQEKNENDFIF